MSFSTVIILVNWNGLEYTTACIESVQDEPADIIVVDNGSVDGSVEKLKQSFPEVYVIQSNVNLGFTGGNNLALEYVMERDCYDHVLLLNNDTEVEPGLIRTLEEALFEDSRVGAVQPLILQFGDRSLVWNGGTNYNKWTNQAITLGLDKKPEKYVDHSVSVPWLTGCALMVKKEALKSIGLLDDRFFAYYEDVDFSFRLVKKGFDLKLIPAAIIYHHAGVSSRAKEKNSEGYLSPMVHYLNVRNRIFILRKHGKGLPLLSSFVITLGSVIAYLSYFILRGRFKKLQAVLRGLRDGFTTRL